MSPGDDVISVFGWDRDSEAHCAGAAGGKPLGLQIADE